MEVQGKIKLVGDVESFASGFQKRSLVVTTDEQYPQHIAIEFLKDKISLLENYNVNDNVKVSINLGGREWINPQGEAKYFNSITGWRIEKVENAPNVPQPPVDIYKPNDNEPDDLPF